MSLTISEALKYALSEIKKLPVGEYEVYVSHARVYTFRGAGRSFRTRMREIRSMSVRLVLDKRLGIALTTELSKNAILDTIKTAYSIARSREPDKNWVSLPEPRKPLISKVEIDESIKSLDVGYVTNLAVEAHESGYIQPEVVSVESIVRATYYREFIVNSNGIECENEGTAFYYDFYSKVKKDGEYTGAESGFSRKIVGDLPTYARKSAERALEMCGAVKLERPYEGIVVLENSAIAELLEFFFRFNLSAFRVQEKHSRFGELIGKEIASRKVSIVDDGTCKDGIHTSIYDAEGVPRQRTPVIVDGVLKTVLYDNYTAKREGKESTGNASRSNGNIVVEPTTLIFKDGSKSLEELIEMFDRCIVIKGHVLGAHTMNEAQGDFSVTALNPFIYERGELKPLKPVTFNGNMFSLLKNIIELGADSKITGWRGCVKVPSIVLQKASIAPA